MKTEEIHIYDYQFDTAQQIVMRRQPLGTMKHV